jgi:hypothetical protein
VGLSEDINDQIVISCIEYFSCKKILNCIIKELTLHREIKRERLNKDGGDFFLCCVLLLLLAILTVVHCARERGRNRDILVDYYFDLHWTNMLFWSGLFIVFFMWIVVLYQHYVLSDACVWDRYLIVIQNQHSMKNDFLLLIKAAVQVAEPWAIRIYPPKQPPSSRAICLCWQWNRNAYKNRPVSEGNDRIWGTYPVKMLHVLRIWKWQCEPLDHAPTVRSKSVSPTFLIKGWLICRRKQTRLVLRAQCRKESSQSSE